MREGQVKVDLHSVSRYIQLLGLCLVDLSFLLSGVLSYYHESVSSSDIYLLTSLLLVTIFCLL